VVNIVLLYRRITSIGKITISLWIGTIAHHLGGGDYGSNAFQGGPRF